MPRPLVEGDREEADAGGDGESREESDDARGGRPPVPQELGEGHDQDQPEAEAAGVLPGGTSGEEGE